MARISIEDIITQSELINPNIRVISEFRVGEKKKTLRYFNCECNIHNEIFPIRHQDLMRKTNYPKCPICKQEHEISIYKIREFLKNNNKNIELLSTEYVNCNSDLKCKCLIDNHIWDSSWNMIRNGSGCPMCAGKVLTKEKTIGYKKPHLIKYFKNKEDAFKYFDRSRSMVWCKCDKCGFEKELAVSHLSRGFSCDMCSVNISKPEKLMINLLNENKIKFKRQYSPDWVGSLRYDFYLFELDIIIEVHGEYHYKKISRQNNDYEKQLLNDKNKYELAIKHNILPEKYLIIDCRKSDIIWLKEQFLKILTGYINTDVNWYILWANSQHPDANKCWDLWNTNKFKSKKELSIYMGIGYDKIKKWIKIGCDAGLCNLKSCFEKEVVIKIPKNKSPVIQYDFQLNEINRFHSIKDAQRITGVYNSSIGECCSGKRKSAGGYIWKYTKTEGETNEEICG